MINRLWNNVLLGNFGAYLKHLETTPQDLFKSDDEGRSVLHWAAFHDDTDVIRQIVKLGLPVCVYISIIYIHYIYMPFFLIFIS